MNGLKFPDFLRADEVQIPQWTFEVLCCWSVASHGCYSGWWQLWGILLQLL